MQVLSAAGSTGIPWGVRRRGFQRQRRASGDSSRGGLSDHSSIRGEAQFARLVASSNAKTWEILTWRWSPGTVP
ncbi:hypothetical protein HYQ46_011336 [Verticillium longisporum]|nr:hypothetical protein HYQ46_011336 [Verticillium longisporum]